MVRPLQALLEREFNLKVYGGFLISELRSMDIRKVDWFYSRLVKKFQDEQEKG